MSSFNVTLTRTFSLKQALVAGKDLSEYFSGFYCRPDDGEAIIEF